MLIVHKGEVHLEFDRREPTRSPIPPNEVNLEKMNMKTLRYSEMEYYRELR